MEGATMGHILTGTRPHPGTLTAGWRRALLGAVLASIGLAAGATGRAEVSYAPQERLTDAGSSFHEIRRTQRMLTAHLESLAKTLPDGQVLKVEVRDIDLAGELETLAPDRVRVLGRVPDSPRLDLRYELLADGGNVLRRGDAVLTDLDYLRRGVSVRRDQPLFYERRLLDDWFHQAVAPGVGASR
jgi:hypothetical protein